MKKYLIVLLLFISSFAYSQVTPFAFLASKQVRMITLVSPTNTQTEIAINPVLEWNDIPLSVKFRVQISQEVDFSSVYQDTLLSDTTHDLYPSLDEGTKWYWRVRHEGTDTTDWSSQYSFTITIGTPIARIYYIDAGSGKNENNGRDVSKPWQSLAKVNSHTFIAGDTILLKGGETFTGQIRHRFTHNDTTDAGAIRYGSYDTTGNGKAIIQLGPTDSLGIGVEFTQHIKVEISNIIIQGLYNPVTQTGGNMVNKQRGIYVWNWTTIPTLLDNKISQIRIKNCQISNIKDLGIVITPGDFGKTLTCQIDSNIVDSIGAGGISMNFNWLSNSRIYGNTVKNIYGFTSQIYTNAIAMTLCKDVTVERNLVYNVGYHSQISGLGIVSGASKKIKIRYNEIYSIYSNTAHDGEAIDLENGTDSSLVEYNYIHNIPGNAILISWGTGDGSIKGSYKAFITERGSLDSGNSDNNVVRYNLVKNFGTNDTAGIPGIYNPVGWVDTLDYPLGKNNQIYNNTIVTTYATSHGNSALGVIGKQDSSKTFNNLVISNATFFWASLDGSPFDAGRDSLRNAYIDNNMYWSPNKSVQFVKVRSTILVPTTISGWNNLTSYESTRYLYNPLLSDAYKTEGDTLNNPFAIESLMVARYSPLDASMSNERGVELSSYILSTPTTDISGNPAKKNGFYNIGAVVNTNSTPYAYNLETKKWLGRQDTIQTDTQMKNKDSLISFLKADALLSKFDIMYMLADINAYSSQRNILKDTFNLIPTNSPTFTAWSGYKGVPNTSTSGYLRTGWYPSSSALNYTLNSSALSIYSNTDLTDAEYIYGVTDATSAIQLYPLVAGGLRNWINQPIGTYTSVANTTSKGMFVMSRTGSTTLNAFVNNNLIQSLTTPSTVITPTYPLYLLTRNYQNGVSGATTREISFFGASSGLTTSEQHRLTDNVEWYLTTIGLGKTPIAPISETPINADTGVSTTVTFDWEKLNNARYYQLQVSTLIDFSGEFAGDLYVYDSTQYTAGKDDEILGYPILTLLNNRNYHWRVRGINSVGNGTWSGIKSFYTPSSYEPESLNLFTRMSYPPSIQRKDLMDSLVKIMKHDTTWQTSDLLYVMSAVDTGNATHNWINSSYRLVQSGSTLPIFTTEQGFRSDGITGYLKTNWIPATNAVNYTLDDGSFSFFSQKDTAQNQFVMGTNNTPTKFMQVNPRTTSGSGNIQSHMNSDVVSNVASTDSKGFFTLSRDNSANYQIYRNGSLLSSVTQTSSAGGLVSTPAQLVILGTNYNGGVANFTTRTISIVRVGASLSAYSENILSRRFEWYLNRIGSFPYVPSAPILLEPADSETDVTTSPDLDWDNVGANYYQIMIDDDSSFATPFYSDSLGSSEFLTADYPTELSEGTTYYWKVRGTNLNGAGSWSPTFSFTTAGSGGGGPLVYPEFVSNMMNDSNANFIPYDIFLNYDRDSILFYYQIKSPKVNFVASSPVTDGVTLYGHRYPVATNPVYDTITRYYPDVCMTPMNDTLIRSFLHKKDPSNQQFQYMLFKSTNRGFTFTLDSSRTGDKDTAYFGDRSSPSQKYTGEDATTFRNQYTDSINVYFRDSTLGEGFIPGGDSIYPMRTIAISRTQDMLNFTNRQVVLPPGNERVSYNNPNSINYRKQYYVFTVVSTASDEYWGIANMMQLPPNRKENQALLHTDSNYNIIPRLYFSENGWDWVPCNDTLPIIDLGPSMHQLFAIPVIADGKMLIYTQDNDTRHSLPDPDDPWRMKLYQISITNLRAFKPV